MPGDWSINPQDFARSRSGLLLPGHEHVFVSPDTARMVEVARELQAQMLGGDWGAPSQDQNSVVITPASPESLGSFTAFPIGVNDFASATWTSANLALYIPFLVYAPITIVAAAWYNGATVTGNCDIGVFDDQQNAIGTLGSTAQSGATGWQPNAVSWKLNPGTYYMGFSMSSATATVWTSGVSGVQNGRVAGILSQASAVPLPTTAATFATLAATISVPLIALSQRAWI